ncbi:MAG: 2-phospho-L-lactate guanylyltransferase [Dehalococcoidia bacterium]|nr:2-phospho-L-lactate guanylyltransferase [Dehalococcoidia bacterium]
MAVKSRIVAVVPMKPLTESKTRLSAQLSPSQRATLSLSMFKWVVQTLGKSNVSRVVVVGGDNAVEAASLREGAEWIKDEYLELNKAIEFAFESVWEEGLSAAYIPADLPLLTVADVNGMIDASEQGSLMTMCRAHDGGTNGIIVPPDLGFGPLLGSDSYRRHQMLAEELKVRYRSYESDGFYRDIDTIEDLRICMDLSPPCLVEIAEALKDVSE